MIEIRSWNKSDQFNISEISGLLLQLCKDCKQITTDHINSILENPNVRLFVAVDSNHIIGSVTLAWYPIPTGIRAWIEDVIVDENHRGKKLGEALVLFAINEAKKLGINQVDLTSRPERLEANKLYQKLGFRKRETNVYRLNLEQNMTKEH